MKILRVGNLEIRYFPQQLKTLPKALKVNWIDIFLLNCSVLVA